MNPYDKKHYHNDGRYHNPPYYLTAYQIAVSRGFKGTVDQWLQSLVGAQGEAPVFRYENQVFEYRYESDPEDTWRTVFDIDEIRSEVISETLDAAEAAKLGAEAAQGLAEGHAADAENAKLAAQAAQQGAETAQGLAGGHAADAENAKLAAQQAQAGAETAQGLSESAMSSAAQAAVRAMMSESAAAQSEANADAYALDSEAWAVGKRGGADVPSTDPAYNNNSKYYMEQASEIAGGDFATKTEAQGYVSSHDQDPNAHPGLVPDLSGYATTALYTVTIPAGGWTVGAQNYEGLYYQTIPLSGILSGDNPVVDILQTGLESTDKIIRENWSKVTRITTAADSITVYATEVLSAAIMIRLKVVR